MFKVDQVKSLFDCCLCSKLSKDLVTLQCGDTICKKHIDKVLENAESREKNEFKQINLENNFDIVTIQFSACENFLSIGKKGLI